MSKLNIKDRLAQITPEGLFLSSEFVLLFVFGLIPGLTILTALNLAFLSLLIQNNFPIRPEILSAKLLRTVLWLFVSACSDFLLFFAAMSATFAPLIGPTNIYGAAHEIAAASLQLAAVIAFLRGFYLFMIKVFYPFLV